MASEKLHKVAPALYRSRTLSEQQRCHETTGARALCLLFGVHCQHFGNTLTRPDSRQLPAALSQEKPQSDSHPRLWQRNGGASQGGQPEAGPGAGQAAGRGEQRGGAGRPRGGAGGKRRGGGRTRRPLPGGCERARVGRARLRLRGARPCGSGGAAERGERRSLLLSARGRSEAERRGRQAGSPCEPHGPSDCEKGRRSRPAARRPGMVRRRRLP